MNVEEQTPTPRKRRRASRATRKVAANPEFRREATKSVAAHPELKDLLRKWCHDTAKKRKLPPYFVLPESALEDLSRMRPSSLPELRRVPGFGDKRVEMYGEQILDTIRSYHEQAVNL